MLHHDQGNDSDNIDVAPKKPHIKKPLNAFMLFMKEMRAKVAAECTLKESAAINQILGRRVSHVFVFWSEFAGMDSVLHDQAADQRILHQKRKGPMLRSR